jgi:uncharacterized protein
LHTADDLELEARWDRPDEPQRCVVFCHPHPLQRGTMTAPLMVAVTEHLVDAGFAVLRFNFRGVGSSHGSHGHGIDELADIDAAIAAAASTHGDLPQAIAGWSFGAATALVWQARRGDGRPYAGIAPPVDSTRAPALPAPDRDQFTSVDAISSYAATIGGTVEVLAGSDHFFYFREERVADIVTSWMR